MHSVSNHYSVSKRAREKDMYSPGGKMGYRPDRATIVYCNKIREAYKSIPIVILLYSFKKISPSQTEILYCDRGSCFCASLSCDFLNPTSVRQTLFRPFKCQVHYIVLQTRCEFDAHFLTYLALQSRQKMGKIVQ